MLFFHKNRSATGKKWRKITVFFAKTANLLDFAENKCYNELSEENV